MKGEPLDALARRIVEGPFGSLIGMERVTAEPDAVVVRLVYRTEVSNGAAVMHGGAMATLIDTAATLCAWSSPDVLPGTLGSTAAMTVTYLAPVRDGVAIAAARTVRRGKRLVVLDVEVRLEDGSPVAKGLVTYNFAPPKGA